MAKGLGIYLFRKLSSFELIPTHLIHRPEKRSHTLRYTLKNRKTNKVLFVVLFTLYLKEDVDEQGHLKEVLLNPHGTYE